jgi:hypothetical protein
LRVETTCLRANRVEVTVVKSSRQIDVLIKNSLDRVDVHIDRDRPVMNCGRFLLVRSGAWSILLVVIHVVFAAVCKKRKGPYERNYQAVTQSSADVCRKHRIINTFSYLESHF